MTDDMPMAYFGSVDTPLPDWRDVDDPDPDDEELAETPPDVIMMLGWDPKEIGRTDGCEPAGQGPASDPLPCGTPTTGSEPR